MVAQARVTVRNAGWLVALRGVHVLSGVVFAVVVPRLMEPAAYGQYALLNSLSSWFVLLGTLGLAQIMGRFVPPLVLRNDPARLRQFLGDLLNVRLASGTLVAGLFLGFTALWLRDLDAITLLLVAAAVLARGVTFYFFSLFLGLNQAARWGAEQVIRRWILVVLLPLGFILGGLRGACLGLLLTDAAMLAIGLRWSKPYLAWPGWRLNTRALTPYLNFGLIFFGSNLLTTAFQRSGEPLVRLVAGDYAQVGYYGAAFSVYLNGALALAQFTLAFAPLLTALRTQGQTQSLVAWIERLLKLLAALGLLAALSALLLADTLVPLVFGKAYRAMADNLIPLAFALVPLGLGSLAGVVALATDRPAATLAAAGVQLAVLWSVGIPLTHRFTSLGTCWAVLVASTAYAACLTWRMWDVLRPAIFTYARVVGLGLIFLPLAAFKSAPITNVLLYAVFVAGYGSALLVSRTITLDELSAAWNAFRVKRRPDEIGATVVESQVP